MDTLKEIFLYMRVHAARPQGMMVPQKAANDGI